MGATWRHKKAKPCLKQIPVKQTLQKMRSKSEESGGRGVARQVEVAVVLVMKNQALCRLFVVIRDNCLSRQGGVAAEPHHYDAAGTSYDVIRRHPVVLAAASAQHGAPTAADQGARPPYAFFSSSLKGSSVACRVVPSHAARPAQFSAIFA